jgi:hypothetical protein
MTGWIKGGIAVAVAVLTATPVLAQDMPREQTRDELRTRDGIYGEGLMTPRERAEYRERIRTMTPGQRAEFRAEHRRRMDQRARERGLRIPARKTSGGQSDPEQRPDSGGAGSGSGGGGGRR